MQDHISEDLENRNHGGQRGAQRKKAEAFTMLAMATRGLTAISELGQRVRRREISPVEITRDCLSRIEKGNPGLNAFITVMAESALAYARTA